MQLRRGIVTHWQTYVQLFKAAIYLLRVRGSCGKQHSKNDSIMHFLLVVIQIMFNLLLASVITHFTTDTQAIIRNAGIYLYLFTSFVNAYIYLSNFYSCDVWNKSLECQSVTVSWRHIIHSSIWILLLKEGEWCDKILAAPHIPGGCQ